ncbi:MAG: NUDIX domain-containing protein [Candidatus Moraniibacteriota bacterium]
MRLPVNKSLYRGLRFFGFPVAWDVSVGGVVFRESASLGREYLLIQYPSGHFEFPRGHIEEGETEEETLRRETEEETGITDLVVYPLRMSARFFYTAKGNEYTRRKREGRGTIIFKEAHYYPAKTGASEVVLSHEHIDMIWLPFEEALEKVTFDNARRILSQTEIWLRQNAHETP